ncbi:MAG: MATE family efflux transporter [Gemmatimonadota bacterium]
MENASLTEKTSAAGIPPQHPATSTQQSLLTTDAPLLPVVLRLALPAVGTTLLQVLFNIVDTFWVGRTLGPAALAGVSTAGYALWIIISVGELVGIGLTAVASRRHGEGNAESAAVATGTALTLSALLGVLVSATGLGLIGPLFRLMHTPPEVTAMGTRFLTVQVLGAVLIYGYFAIDAGFRSGGDTRTPFVILGISVLLNLLLDPVMILGLGPVPRMGVYGAALATVLTRGFGFLAGFVVLARRRGVRLAFDPAIAWRIIVVGLPVMLAGFLFSGIYILLVPTVRAFGVPALAALGVGHKIEGLSYMMSVGFGLAAATLVGQNLGAGKPERARRAGWVTALVAAVPTLLLGVLFACIPRTLAGIFTTDPATIADAALYLRFASLVQVALAFEEVLFASLSGAGYTFWPMIWVAVLSAIRIPLAPLVALRWGLAGIWALLAVTALGRGVSMAMLWKFARWDRIRA